MKKKMYSIILTLLLVVGITSVGEVKAEEVCKQETHWYYFSLADHGTKEEIASKQINTTYQTAFSNSSWPEGAEIESITTYKGFSREDIALWFDMYVGMKVPTYTDENGEIHHVHYYLYHNLDSNISSTINVDDATRLNYDLVSGTAAEEFRNNYINNVYNAQIIPSEAEITITSVENGAVNAEISRTYGGTSLDSVTAYSYVLDPSEPSKTEEVYLISAKAKIVLKYDCTEEEPVVEPEEPVVEPEEPIVEEPLEEEPNPNTSDFGVILSGLMMAGASGTGLYAYRKRKSLL